MYYTFNGSLFIDMYEMMGNNPVLHRLNWIPYLGIVCVMKSNKSANVEVMNHAEETLLDKLCFLRSNNLIYIYTLDAKR